MLLLLQRSTLYNVHATELTDYRYNTYRKRSPLFLCEQALWQVVLRLGYKKVLSRWLGKLYCQTRPFILPVATFYIKNDELSPPTSSICLSLWADSRILTVSNAPVSWHCPYRWFAFGGDTPVKMKKTIHICKRKFQKWENAKARNVMTLLFYYTLPENKYIGWW